jgi:hypothetical protein
VSPAKELCAESVSAVVLAEDFNTKKSELSFAVQIGGFAKAVAKGIVQLVRIPLPTTTMPAESLPAIVGDVPQD